MSKITVLNEKAIAVHVTETANNFSIYEQELMFTDKKPDDPYPLGLDDLDGIDLPPGSWQILGRPEEITEEQWKGIVDTYPDDGCGGFAYMDYTSCVNGFETAKESGLDLLKSKGLNPESIIILIKK